MSCEALADEVCRIQAIGPLRRAVILAAFWAFVFFQPVAPPEARSEAKTDPSHVEVLFSAEDELCEPLADVYDRLYREHGPGRHLVLDWERQFSGRFRAIGLIEPQRVSDLPTPDRFGAGPVAYYRVDFSNDDRNRLIYVEDQCVGRCDEFSTVIWVFNSGASARLKEYKWPDGEGQVHEFELFDPAVIESALSFELKPREEPKPDPTYPRPTYPTVYARFFDKIASAHDRSLSILERLNRHDIIIAGGSGPFIQQVWRFNGKAIFTARDFWSNVLVYRYAGANAIEDICYLAR